MGLGAIVGAIAGETIGAFANGGLAFGHFVPSLKLLTPIGSVAFQNYDHFQLEWSTVAGGGGKKTLNTHPQKLLSNGVDPTPVFLSQQGAYYSSSFTVALNKMGKNSVHFKGYFNDAPIYESDFFNGGGVTLPPSGIYVGEGVYLDGLIVDHMPANYNEMLLRHEYGHWIDWEENGSFYYYGIVAPQSAAWASRRDNSGPRSYSQFWTEKRANTLSYYFFGKPAWWDPDWLHY